jgi:hypothetical protein
MEVDAGVLRDAGGATVAFMSSLLWQGCSAAINIARLQGTRVVVRVHVGNETLESDWEDIVGELPVMAIASTCHEGPRTEAFTSTVAMEMLLTGGFIDAGEAQRRGLVNRVVRAEQLDAEVESLLAAILAKPRLALAMGKQLFYQQAEMGIEAAYQLAGQTMACNMLDEVAQEGVQAFIDKREPTWRT